MDEEKKENKSSFASYAVAAVVGVTSAYYYYRQQQQQQPEPPLQQEEQAAAAETLFEEESDEILTWIKAHECTAAMNDETIESRPAMTCVQCQFRTVQHIFPCGHLVCTHCALRVMKSKHRICTQNDTCVKSRIHSAPLSL